MKKITLILAGLAFVSCKKESADNDFSKVPTVNKSELAVKASNFFKSVSTLTEDNIPQEKIDLGKKLFYDKALSKNESISCNSCHNLAAFGVDNQSFSLGDTKKLGGRNSPSVIYASLHSMQFWDGRAKDVEEQAKGPLLNPVEHGIPNKEFLEKRLRAIPEYQAMFKKVFPNDKEPITFDNLAKAIAAFESKLHPKSKFDNYLEGKENALNQQEKKGLENFIDNGCVTCHSGVAVGGQMFQKFGIYSEYAKLTHSTKIDKGLFDRTKQDGDQFMFKVPSLRNAEKTAPYFHDGSVASLKEAIQIMGKLQLNKDISDNDANDMVAFLKTLTADVDAK
ncbi:cytochrome-c peroxidase [Flavobacterium gilvum]|uniref:Cytochrome-c peroxidase n=1 Tax=Flavobacterium gilvum TaxID=1492737 RepID=A0AAC9I3A1_9FLAO|nr:cytochrome-c peroxidase [Flavobacterium gilvum]AOW08676.1 cytochrome-c peroxidase [Flavobacterium gilvum]KFC59896.1 cytochrome C peroxidase [Flavobacterium gilvum]